MGGNASDLIVRPILFLFQSISDNTFSSYQYIMFDNKYEPAKIINKINQFNLLSNQWFVHVNHSNTDIITISKKVSDIPKKLKHINTHIRNHNGPHPGFLHFNQTTPIEMTSTFLHQKTCLVARPRVETYKKVTMTAIY